MKREHLGCPRNETLSCAELRKRPPKLVDSIIVLARIIFHKESPKARTFQVKDCKRDGRECSVPTGSPHPLTNGVLDAGPVVLRFRKAFPFVFCGSHGL